MEAILLAIALGIGAWIVLGTKPEPLVDPEKPKEPEALIKKQLVVPGDQVWLLGDSLALGLESHLLKLATGAGVAFKTTAKNGARIAWGKTQVVTPPIASVWLVCLGANDAAGDSRGPDQSTQDAVLWILRRAESDGVREVVWLLPPNGGGLKNWQNVTDAIREAAWTLAAPAGLPFASDGVHLSGNGYKVWAEHVWKELTE